MNDNHFQKAQAIYIQQPPYSEDDEISLVDITLLLARHKRLILSVFVLCLLAGLALALTTPRQYDYSHSIEIGGQMLGGRINPFESPQTLQAKLENSFIPQTLLDFQQKQPEDATSFKIKSTIPKDSQIIVLKIKTSEEKAEQARSLLNSISLKAINDHQRLYNAIRQNLQSLLNHARAELAALGPDNGNLAEKKRLLESSIEGYTTRLATLQQTRSLSPVLQSAEPTGIGNTLIILISALAGFFLALMSAFLVEFAGRVRQRLKQQADDPI